MHFSSNKAKVILILIAISAFIVPAVNITQEAQDAYDRAAYDRLISSLATAAPSASQAGQVSATAAPSQDAGQSAAPAASQAADQTAAPAATDAATNAPAAYKLPMDTYVGGSVPLESGYSTIDYPLSDGTTVKAQHYEDPTIEATYYTQRYFASDCNFVIIKIKDPSQLRTAISKEVMGSSTCITSKMAAAKNAVVAMSGEYYSQRKSAVFVVKQSQVLKSTPADKLHQLIIDTSGNFHITTDQASSAQMIAQLNGKIYQAFSFGPALVIDGQEVEYPSYYFDADSGNPRAALGQLGELEYLFCVANGRTGNDKGLSTMRLAQVMAEKGCKNAYNLDGGGSSTLYWHGQVVNQMNKTGTQRDISDCVYFASAYPEN